MYFSALKRLIGSVEEKLFYDVAILFLGSQGYKQVSIVDGSGDGGRDVVCSRVDLRIQLSVQKAWENKLNDEAAKTLKAGKRHFIYITNRIISPDQEADFLTNRYKLAGSVDVSLFDLNIIATSLAHSSFINRAYSTLGANPDIDLNPTPREVALSSILLFGVEAQNLREKVVEANLTATLFDSDTVVSETELISQIDSMVPGVNVARLAEAAISRLRLAGTITGPQSDVKLSEAQSEKVVIARRNFSQLLESDLSDLMKVSGLTKSESRFLLTKARNLLVRGSTLDGSGAVEEEFRSFMANKQLESKRTRSTIS